MAPCAARPLGLGPRHRHLRHRLRRGQRRSPRAALPTRPGRSPPRRHAKCASSTSSWRSEPRGPPQITGIGPRRAEIIVPGVAVLLEFLQEFHLPAVYYSRAGVRDGIIADLAARNVGAELSASAAISAARSLTWAGATASRSTTPGKSPISPTCCFTALQPLHQMPPGCGKLLEAAAYLHDVGHFVSNTGHHKHSYYVVANSDMAGFTERERLLIAGLCRYHRKSLPNRCTSVPVAFGGRKAYAADDDPHSPDRRQPSTAAASSASATWNAACATAKCYSKSAPAATSTWHNGAPSAPAKFFSKYTTDDFRDQGARLTIA